MECPPTTILHGCSEDIQQCGVVAMEIKEDRPLPQVRFSATDHIVSHYLEQWVSRCDPVERGIVS
jgi:hypothetical protein